jgi:hypothetical protein
MEKIRVKIRDFTFGFAKGKLLKCESLPFSVQKDSFWKGQRISFERPKWEYLEQYWGHFGE